MPDVPEANQGHETDRPVPEQPAAEPPGTLAARSRPHRAPTAKPRPETAAPEDEGTANGASGNAKPVHADYQWVVNVAAGVVTLAAGVLGVFGVTAGVAVALLRNAPEAVATASLAGGVAVLLGVASAFIPPKLRGRQHLSTTWVITILTAGLIVTALVTTGIAFTSRAEPTLQARVLWWLFLGVIGLLMVGGAVAVIVKGRDYPLKTLAIFASLAVFGVSVLCVVVLAAGETRTATRPAVSVTLEFKPASANTASTTATSAATPTATSPRGSFVLHVTVKSLGLTSDERYLVAVDRFDQSFDVTQVTEVYRTYAGPDAAGNVQYTFSIPLAADKMVPWIGVIAILQRLGGFGEPSTYLPSQLQHLCDTGAQHRDLRAPSTCSLVYADPSLTSS